MVCDLLLVHFDPFCVFLCFKVRCFWTLELTWILGLIPLITHPTFLWNFCSNIEQFACLTDATSATIFNKTESTLFECECIWLESTNWGLYFNVPFWRRHCHFTWSSDPREDQLSRLQGKGSTFISQLFKTLSSGPAPGIKPATSRSAVKSSTDWATKHSTASYQHTLIQEGLETLLQLTYALRREVFQ